MNKDFIQIDSTKHIFIVGFQTGILKMVVVPLKELAEGKILNLTEIQVGTQVN